MTANPASLTVQTAATAVNVLRRIFVDVDPVLGTITPGVACRTVRVAATAASASRRTFAAADPDTREIVTAADASRLPLAHRSADTDIPSIPIPVDASPHRQSPPHRTTPTVDTAVVLTATAVQNIIDASVNRDTRSILLPVDAFP